MQVAQLQMFNPLPALGHKVQSCTCSGSCTWWWKLQLVMGATESQSPCQLPPAGLSCRIQAHEATSQVSPMHCLEGAQHALEKTRTPWAATLPPFFFWEGKTGDWEQAPVLELTLQTWHREMPASPSRNPSWTSTGLLCSPVVQPWAQGNKSASSFPS